MIIDDKTVINDILSNAITEANPDISQSDKQYILLKYLQELVGVLEGTECRSCGESFEEGVGEGYWEGFREAESELEGKIERLEEYISELESRCQE